MAEFHPLRLLFQIKDNFLSSQAVLLTEPISTHGSTPVMCELSHLVSMIPMTPATADRSLIPPVIPHGNMLCAFEEQLQMGTRLCLFPRKTLKSLSHTDGCPVSTPIFMCLHLRWSSLRLELFITKSFLSTPTCALYLPARATAASLVTWSTSLSPTIPSLKLLLPSWLLCYQRCFIL